MDDQKRSINPEISLARELGFKVNFFPAVQPLANYLSELDEDQLDNVAAMLLDMKMKEQDLRDIDLENVKTEQGTAVGLAFAERFLRAGRKRYSQVPVAFLTGFPMTESIQQRITKLSQGPQDAVVLHKGVQLPALARFLSSARKERSDKSARKKRSGPRTLSAPSKPERQKSERRATSLPRGYRHDVGTAARIVWEMFETPAERAGAFGLRSAPFAGVEDFERFALDYPTVDFHDRAILIMDMKMRLEALSGGSLGVQRQWLAAKPASLRGERPLDLVCNGHLHDLKRVVGALRLVTG